MSTMYKNALSKILTVDIAEKLLGIVEPGTHDWDKYIDLKDLVEMADYAGLELI
jgi:2-polyprenyl-3-methyl-5-hydroxy-6-metoxy-1,4-benzoquinol methylase